MAITIVIDDRDPAIRYVGEWVPGSESNHTLHGSSKVGSQAIFKFQGSSVSVFGTLLRGAARTPTASFSVDESGATIYKGKPLESLSLVRQIFYSSPKLDPFKQHTLVITVVNITINGFWLDYFEIVREDAVLSAPNVSSSGSATSDGRPATITTLASSDSSKPTFPSLTPTISSAPSAGSAMIIAGQSSQPSSNSTGASSLTIPFQTVASTTETQSQSSSGSTAIRSRGTIIGIAVGSTVGGLLLLAVLAILFCVFLRKKKARKAALSDYRATAFFSTTVHQDTSTTSPTSPGGYESGVGYVVRGGLSKEKTASYRSSEGGRESSGQRVSGNIAPEPLPAYQSEFGDAVPPRRLVSRK